MNFAELPPSKQWATLKYRGEKFAEVWFKPEDDPLALIFSIPQENFHVSGMGEQMTLANLLKAVAIRPEEVESWYYGDVTHFGRNGTNPDLETVLPPLPPPATHLDIYVRLKPPQARSQESGDRNQETGIRSQTPDSSLTPDPCLLNPDRSEPEATSARWQELDARWKAILALEATLDTVRMSMEGLLNEMESSFKKILTIEEKTYALRADVSQWERAKNRVHFALPKVKDFIHRAVWALGLPERKRLGELYKDHIQPQIPFPEMEEVLKQLEELQKDRQVLAAVGKTVHQEAKSIAADVQSSLKTLQNNARAKRIKGATGPKGRFLK